MSRNPQHIVMTDDDLDDYYMFQSGLREVDASIKLTYFSCCKCLLNYLRSSNSLPDLIVLDMNMPEINGYECLLEIKKMEKAAHIPVIIYSTSGDEAIVRSAYRHGAYRYIIKPYTLDLIKHYIRDLLVIPVAEPLPAGTAIEVNPDDFGDQYQSCAEKMYDLYDEEMNRAG
ncbi:MAG: response regulator [Bacteroidetes bacterium]|nr:response regulator [Bacteroidota bacterium]